MTKNRLSPSERRATLRALIDGGFDPDLLEVQVRFLDDQAHDPSCPELARLGGGDAPAVVARLSDMLPEPCTTCLARTQVVISDPAGQPDPLVALPAERTAPLGSYLKLAQQLVTVCRHADLDHDGNDPEGRMTALARAEPLKRALAQFDTTSTPKVLHQWAQHLAAPLRAVFTHGVELSREDLMTVASRHVLPVPTLPAGLMDHHEQLVRSIEASRQDLRSDPRWALVYLSEAEHVRTYAMHEEDQRNQVFLQACVELFGVTDISAKLERGARYLHAPLVVGEALMGVGRRRAADSLAVLEGPMSDNDIEASIILHDRRESSGTAFSSLGDAVTAALNV